MRSIPFGILLLLLCITAKSQLPFKKFGVKNYGNSVLEPFHSGGPFTQDSLGRLEFSNYIFDGHEFIKKPGPDQNGKLLAIDRQGGKWTKKEHFEILYSGLEHNFQINTQQYFKYDVNTVYLYEQEVYLLTNLGAIQYQWQADSLHYIQSIPISSEEIWSMHKIKDTLFFKTIEQSLFILESDMGTEYRYGKKDLAHYNNGIFYLPNDRIILKRYFYEKTIGPASTYFSTLSKLVDDKNIVNHLLDSENRLWLSMRGNGRNGFFLAEEGVEQLEKIDLNIESNIYLFDIFEDSQKNIWVSTTGQGIVQLYKEKIQTLDKSFGLSSDNIWSISQDQMGNIYFSTGCSGIDVLESDGKQRHTFGTNCQSAILHDSKGNFWVNTRGVTKVLPDGKIINYQKESGLISRTPTVLFEDSQGDIWIGTRKAIHKYNPAAQQTGGKIFTPFTVDGIEEFDRVLAMQEYKTGKYILAFNSGKLFTFNGTQFKSIPFNDGVNTVFKDLEGTIWIASTTSGLFTFKNENIQRVDIPDLPQQVKMIQDDRQGMLWGICEDNRIFSISKSKLLNPSNDADLKYFSINDGVPLIASNNDIQPNTKLLQDGRIIFPNIYGAILIDPNNANSTVHDFHTQILAGDRTVEDPVNLAYGENDINLQLKAIILAKNKSVQFQYKTNDDWEDVAKNGMLTLNNLPAGNNKIELRTLDSNGNIKPINPVYVVVPALFYERWYFWLLASGLLTGLIVLFIRWRTGLVKQRNKLLKAKVEEQTKALEIEKQQLSTSLDTQKKLTHELNLSQAAKNRMYAQISHEFKSPLQAIKANLNNGDGTLIVENNKRISANINNLINISNEIMDLSKAESGKLKANKNWYNINGIIKEQIILKQPLAQRKNIELLFQYDVKKYYLLIDISLMQKVLGNLLSNAIKFSSNNDVIRIISKEEDEKYLIQIVDSGVGIPNEDISKLTLPYFQASNNMEGGTGIGLSLSEQILLLHDSRLEIDSALGKGSTFSFRLSKPAITQELILQKHINLTDIDHQLLGILENEKPILLAVDDSEDVLYFLDQTLSKHYQLIKVNNGEAALKVLEKTTPELIISDVNMPMMNGMQLLKTIRSFPEFKTVPFLFLSGSLSEDTELQSIKAGADFVMQKPIQEEYLISKLQQMLDLRKDLAHQVKSAFNHNLIPQNIHNDDLFLIQELEQVILANISQSDLKSADIASLLGMGEKTLRNRVKGIVGLTLKEYLRRIRLEKAKLLIEEEYGNLGEVAAATGFSSLSYFSKSFKAYFGKKQA